MNNEGSKYMHKTEVNLERGDTPLKVSVYDRDGDEIVYTGVFRFTASSEGLNINKINGNFACVHPECWSSFEIEEDGNDE